MVEIVTTGAFRIWFERLRDEQAKARIQSRLDRAAMGNLGDWKPVGGGVSEMRLTHGPGYRIYFTQRGRVLIVVLAGGTKSTQSADIARAKEIAAQFKE